MKQGFSIFYFLFNFVNAPFERVFREFMQTMKKLIMKLLQILLVDLEIKNYSKNWTKLEMHQS